MKKYRFAINFWVQISSTIRGRNYIYKYVSQGKSLKYVGMHHAGQVTYLANIWIKYIQLGIKVCREY